MSILRTFRDRVLAARAAGRAFIAAYDRLSPPLAQVVARHDLFRSMTRGALRPMIWAARFTLAMPRVAVVLLAGAGGALLAIVVVVMLAAWGYAPRRRVLVTTFVLAFVIAVGLAVPDRVEHDRSASARSAVAPGEAGPAAHGPKLHVRTAQPVEPPRSERYDVDMSGTMNWPPTLSTGLKARPTFSRLGIGYEIESDLGDGFLTTEGFTVTDPKLAATVGLRSGDRIVTINGHSPAGGAFMALLLMQRDPDSNVVNVHLDRDGRRMERTIVLH